MTVGELIAQKDYDYMSWYVVGPDGCTEMFFGCTKNKDGELIPLDSDSYYESTEILRYEEWSNSEVENGVTIVFGCDWCSLTDL